MSIRWTPAEDRIVRRHVATVPTIPGRTRYAVLARRKRLGVGRLAVMQAGPSLKSRVLRVIRENPGIPTPRLVILARVEHDNRRAAVWRELRDLLAAGRVQRRIVRNVAVWELATVGAVKVG
jgi:hypothetical protein